MFINITIPVYNEEEQLASSIGQLVVFLEEHCRFTPEVVIADNASTDGTPGEARSLERRFKCVSYYRMERKGRGGALKEVWRQSTAEICSYMDVDLSTDLGSLPSMIEAIACRGFDLGTGSRLMRPETTLRGIKREIISRSYNLLVRSCFQTQFSDAQCGFKAINRKAVERLLPLVEDTNWFFDTELLLLATALDYKIFDFPVCWKDDPDSRVRIIKTAMEDIQGLIRVRRQLRRNEELHAQRLSRLHSPRWTSTEASAFK